jgi:hypothetical protein
MEIKFLLLVLGLIGVSYTNSASNITGLHF